MVKPGCASSWKKALTSWIVDHKIPMMSGLDLIREVRSRDAAVPIILISNTPTANDDAYGAGITHFLDKAHLLRDLPLFLNAALGKTTRHDGVK